MVTLSLIKTREWNQIYLFAVKIIFLFFDSNSKHDFFIIWNQNSEGTMR